MDQTRKNQIIIDKEEGTYTYIGFKPTKNNKCASRALDCVSRELTRDEFLELRYQSNIELMVVKSKYPNPLGKKFGTVNELREPYADEEL